MVAARAESVLEADDELALAAAPRLRKGAKPFEEGQDPRVVAADRRDELGDARGARVGGELPARVEPIPRLWCASAIAKAISADVPVRTSRAIPIG